MKTKKTIAIIPARGGSKRIPSKNIKLLGDLPLLAYSINYAKSNMTVIDEVYVSTDDEEIKKTARKFGAKVIDRPIEISGDLEPTITTIEHALTLIKDVGNIILLQPTSPFRPKYLLQNAFKLFLDLNSDSLFTVSRDLKKLGKISDNIFSPFNYKIGQRSQDLEPLYFENGLLYIAKASTIKQGKIISENAFPLKVDHRFSEIDIDTIEDLKYAEYILSTSKKEI
jgi:CMP-N-acetylneuraminic acid synthetase